MRPGRWWPREGPPRRPCVGGDAARRYHKHAISRLISPRNGAISKLRSHRKRPRRSFKSSEATPGSLVSGNRAAAKCDGATRGTCGHYLSRLALLDLLSDTRLLADKVSGHRCSNAAPPRGWLPCSAHALRARPDAMVPHTGPVRYRRPTARHCAPAVTLGYLQTSLLLGWLSCAHAAVRLLASSCSRDDAPNGM